MKFKFFSTVLLISALGTGCRNMTDLTSLLQNLESALTHRDSTSLLSLSNEKLASQLNDHPAEIENIFDLYASRESNSAVVEIPWIDRDQNGQNDNNDTAATQVYRLLLKLPQKKQMTAEIHCTLQKSTDRLCLVTEISSR